MKPTTVTVDGNLFSIAITNAILGNMPAKDVIFNGNNQNPMFRGRGLITTTFLNTIFNSVNAMMEKGLNVTSVSIAWDRRKDGKYYKSEILDKLDGDSLGYKGDRKYLTEADLSKMKEEYEALTDVTKMSEMKEALLETEKSIILSRERYAALDLIKKILSDYGVNSFYVEGYEADDLDYVWGLETNKLGGKHIHFTADSDWAFHLTGDDVFWQSVRGKDYVKKEADIREANKIPDNLGLMDWAELYFSSKGNHNNLEKTFDPSIKRVTQKYLDKLYKGDFTDISDKQRFEAQRKCFRILDFPNIEKVKELHKETLSFTPTKDLSEFKEVLSSLHVGDQTRNFLSSNLTKFVSGIRKNILDQIV